jgi:hypothetical protein
MAKAILLFANFFTALKHGAIPGQDHLVQASHLDLLSPKQNCLNHDLYDELMNRIKERDLASQISPCGRDDRRKEQTSKDFQYISPLLYLD